LIRRCITLSPDIVLFPACAALVRRREELCGLREDARGLPLVAMGVLKVQEGEAQGEFSEIWEFGKVVGSFDANFPIALKAGGLNLVAAQSSTIKKVYQNPERIVEAEGHPIDGQPQLALDLGHAQYNGRYKRVLASLAREGMGAVLSFWRSQSGGSRFVWAAPRPNGYRRLEIGPLGDFIDIIEAA